MVKLEKPTKGVRPKMDGVPGLLMHEAPPDVLFGRFQRTSPYDPLLLQLKNAGTGKFLKFEDLRARASVYARAKKLGIKIMFGEQGTVLWVTLATAEIQTNGHVEAQPATPSNCDLILKAIDSKRCTAGEIVSWMRSNGASGIGISLVDGLISNLARAGKIKLVPGRVKGDDVPERWVRA